MNKLIDMLKDYEKLKHYFVYLVFGVLATIVDFLTFYLLDKYVPILDKNISNAVAIFLATVFAYFTNSKYVFESQGNNRLEEFFRFFLGRMFSMGFNIFAFWVLTTITTIDELIIKLINSVVVIILNYIISKFFVFSKKEGR